MNFAKNFGAAGFQIHAISILGGCGPLTPELHLPRIDADRLRDAMTVRPDEGDQQELPDDWVGR